MYDSQGRESGRQLITPRGGLRALLKEDELLRMSALGLEDEDGSYGWLQASRMLTLLAVTLPPGAEGVLELLDAV